MEKEDKKEMKQIENSQYKERFQFIFQINNDIIVQRYFKINGLSVASLESEELKLVLDECVRMIQDDLVSKSRVYEDFTFPTPLKLTGFLKNTEDYTDVERRWVVSNTDFDKLQCQNGDIIEKTYCEFPINNVIDPDNGKMTKGALIDYMDNERPADGEYMFKFTFMADDRMVYQRIWDANVLHKAVRNSVDISNNDAIIREKKPSELSFQGRIMRGMVYGKIDLIYHIIKKICNVMSASYEADGNEYTRNVKYGDKTYCYSTYNKKYVNDWRKATEQKTREYFNSLYPSDKYIDYIDRRL